MKVLIIGRDAACNVVINDKKVSRSHCQLVCNDDGNCSVIDLGSTNGTFVNGVKITGKTILNPHDSVRIGDTELHWQKYIPARTTTRKWIWAAASAIVVVLLMGGATWMLLHNSHEPGDDIWHGLTDEKKEIDQLQKEVDALLLEASLAKNDEYKESLERQVEEKRKIIAEKERLLKENDDLKTAKKQLENKNNELGDKNNELGDKNKELEGELDGKNKELEKAKDELKSKNEELVKFEADKKYIEKASSLKDEFWALWSSLGKEINKQDFQKDVYEQYYKGEEHKGVVNVPELFKEVNNQEKEKLLAICKVTRDYYDLLPRINDRISEMVFEYKDWPRISGPKASKDDIRKRFLFSSMEDKYEMIKAIKYVLDKSVDETAVDDKTDKDGDHECEENGCEHGHEEHEQ